MSEVSAPVTFHDAGAFAHPSKPSRSGTSLLDFPSDATFQIWRKPPTGVEPKDGGSLHVSELIHGDGNHVLVCFATMATDDWDAIKRALTTGNQLNLHPLLVGAIDRTHIACGLWGAGQLAGLHGLTNAPTHPTVFVPSLTLMCLLGIAKEQGRAHTRNALILIRNGLVAAEWISGGYNGSDGDRSHDWTTILALVG